MRRGYMTYGIGALWEVIRWHYTVEKEGEFKCRNAFRSRYARYLMWKHDDLRGFFDTTKLKSE
jgi:hypothetical protein